MIFEKWIKFGIVSVITVFVIGHLGCERIQPPLMPADTIVPLSPETNRTLIEPGGWQVTSIDGDTISESLSRFQTLVAEYVSEDINISFAYEPPWLPRFFLNADDGTWKLYASYVLLCRRKHVDLDPIEISSMVSIVLSVSGTYIAGFDTEKQSNVLVFETEKHTQITISHENPYSDPDFTCIPEFECPERIIYPAFTADLDWSIFHDDPLSKLFSSPLFDTQSGTPAVYTWDVVTSEGTPEDYWSERGWAVSDDIVLGSLVRYTLRLYSQEQEDIVLRRTEERDN